MFPKIVVQKEALHILDEFGIKSKEKHGNYVACSIEAVSKLTVGAIDSGVKIFNCISIEDVVIRGDKIAGLVLNWSPVMMASMHVDPLAIASTIVVDATGHDAEVCKVVQRKAGKLNTPSGEIEGERSMWADKSETLVVENTREVYKNLFVTGMAANAVFGAPRMGPIFGGMLLSGKMVSDLILERL